MKTLLAITLALICLTCRAAEPIRILAWNIESGGSDTAVIIDQLKTQMPKHDIVALSEVPSNAIEPIAKALGWKHFGGSRGGEDRLMIAWSDRFTMRGTTELRELKDKAFPGGNNRAPVMAYLLDNKSNKGFAVMNNHLTRGNEATRNLQAELLVETQKIDAKLPIIAVGDYNMDYDFKTKKGNSAFDIIQKDGHWKWIAKKLIDTNWADPDGDGKDNYPDSMLDFVFVNQAAQKWSVECEVVVREGDFPDDKKTSDHRPVLAMVDFSPLPPDEFISLELNGEVAAQFSESIRRFDPTFEILSIGYCKKSDRYTVDLGTIEEPSLKFRKSTAVARSLIFEPDDKGIYLATFRHNSELTEVMVILVLPKNEP